MIETICTPYGKAAFPTVVKCDGCGAVIDSGWMHSYSAKLHGNDVLFTDEDRHWCDECAEKLDGKCEFRVCERCGHVMTQGFVIGDACTTVCEDCFEPWMDENCDAWRANEHEDDRLWDGGYYDELIDGEWVDTGAYWTEWY